MKEIWKQIENYQDYQVSNLGRVKSLKKGKERILKAGVDGVGYFTVALCNLGQKAKTYKVHQLVAMAFLGHNPCKMKLVINHKDSNKLNNNIDNLEIVTPIENIRHSLMEKGHDINSLHHNSCISKIYWHKRYNKWQLVVRFNCKNKHLGYFDEKKLALIALSNYQNSIM